MKNHLNQSRPILVLFLCVLLSMPFLLYAQHKEKKDSYTKGKGPEDFPELVFANIPGAPKLGKPQLITGRLAPVIGEGMGWASPAVYDWDGDGKKDLLIGEFGSLIEHKGIGGIGNFVRVYKNEGTKSQPSFSGIFNYAGGRMGEDYYGTPLSVYTWCCMAFTPRFADLDNDGFQDLITGQYNPGYITWFRGSEDGFLPGQRLKQAGDPLEGREMADITDTTGFDYWNYSAAAFGDFDGDGDADMIVGGGALRISENIGTKSAPKFGLRKLLLDTNEKPLTVSKHITDRDLAGGMTVPYVTDWDNDGVLDLMVTYFYTNSGDVAVTFFRGLKTAKGLRFEPGIPLFSAKSGGKALPGSTPNICVTDWNNDGVNDLVIGVSVATIKGEFDYKLSWAWENKTGIFKQNPVYNSLQYKELVKKDRANLKIQQKKKGWTDKQMKDDIQKSEKTNQFLYGEEDHPGLAHQGYVYVMLGTKN